MSLLIIYSLIGGAFSLIGGIALLTLSSETSKKIMVSLLSFAAGAFLSAAMLDILPEAIESVAEPHPVMLAALIGFTAYFLLERLLMRYTKHGDEHAHRDHTETLPILVILGDALHNLLDGIVIALAYLANPSLGLVTTLAVAAHEIPQEVGDFSILLNNGWKKSSVILINLAVSLLSVVGVVIGYSVGSQFETYLPYALAITAGIFLYIAASDLIPEVHHQAGHKHVYRVIIPFVIALILVYYFVRLAHGE